MSRVLVIGDTHCPVMAEGYIDFLRDIYKGWQCNAVIHIGDVVDWSAISYHEKNPNCPSAGDEYELAKKQVAQLVAAFPRVTVMTGNHDDLLKRQARSAGIPEQMIRSYAEVWNTPHWDWKPRFTNFFFDGVCYRHGDKGKGGQQAALKNAKDQFCSLVQGHNHSQAGVEYYSNSKGSIFALSTGCGIDVEAAAMDYGQRFTAKPVLGCGVVIDGKHAYYEQMAI